MKKISISKIAFALALPGTILAYGTLAASFVIPAFATYSGSTYVQHSAKTGRILKTDHLSAYPEKPTSVSDTFRVAQQRAKQVEASR